ncbi:MAG: hypothetical protein AAGD07_02355 [Planctomycetota bacterium]
MSDRRLISSLASSKALKPAGWNRGSGDARCYTFSIRFVLYLTAVVAIAKVAFMRAPSFGFLYSFDVLCVGYLFGRFARVPRRWALRERRGLLDTALIVYACLMLHAIQVIGVHL